MANLFSNLMASAQTDDYSSSYRGPSGQAHSRVRTASPRIDLASGASLNDTFTLKTFKSGDRIIDIRCSTEVSTPTTGALDTGLYKASMDHDPANGTLIDIDLFQDNQAVTSILARQEAFTDGVLADIHRHKTLWELATVGAGSYTEDPMEDWDLVATVVTAIDAAQEILWEIDYIAFG